jgi:hypothetical protein
VIAVGLLAPRVPYWPALPRSTEEPLSPWLPTVIRQIVSDKLLASKDVSRWSQKRSVVLLPRAECLATPPLSANALNPPAL